MNILKTTFLMALLTVLLVFVGNAVAGQNGAVIAFIIAAGMNFFSYWFSDKMVLKMYRAQPVTESEAPKLYSMVRRLSQQARLPMPKVYIIPNDTPNAFATGRDPQHAAVAVTSGIMRILNQDELEGVISHELAHVKHRDILIGSVAATLAGAINMLYYIGFFFGGSSEDRNPFTGILMLILAPIAAMLIQMGISRSREYAADRGGAEICGKPLALASALENLERGVERIPMEANPTSAHMFIVNPLRGAGGLTSLFSTHPSTEERVRRLREMARGN